MVEEFVPVTKVVHAPVQVPQVQEAMFDEAIKQMLGPKQVHGVVHSDGAAQNAGECGLDYDVLEEYSAKLSASVERTLARARIAEAKAANEAAFGSQKGQYGAKKSMCEEKRIKQRVAAIVGPRRRK